MESVCWKLKKPPNILLSCTEIKLCDSNHVDLTILYTLATSRHHSTHFYCKYKTSEIKKATFWYYPILALIFGTQQKVLLKNDCDRSSHRWHLMS